MSKNQILILVIVAIIIVVIIVLAFKYSKNKSEQQKETTTTTSTSSTTGLAGLLGTEGAGSAIGGIIAGLSDERFKENSSKYMGGSKDIMNLIPYNFMYKRADGTEPCCDDCAESGSHCDNKEKVGFMAQQVETFNPSLVVEDANGIKYVDYGMITAMNTAALRDQNNRIDVVEKMLKMG